MMGGTQPDFEFERRFFVSHPPQDLLKGSDPNVIVQTYFLAEDGYALRVRLQATAFQGDLPLSSEGKSVIETLEDSFDLCMLTVKGPMVGGTRYEAERELDIGIGIEMCLRGGKTLVKKRYGVWLDEDGWVIDLFCTPNAPLVIAECERTGPVTDLAIPSFCTIEVTDDARFSNDSLVHNPYSTWVESFQSELRNRNHDYMGGFGDNSLSSL
ncbi:hypothetical protein FYJ24_08055 [Actinomycetaceae bacterium WB03_NA08]|uniref:CYTH domain-containing protein n=2 Tax=Scrofimicrobium canadense TaxID=2652290 RepID=A0A6N7W619_9ACTO|nr:hypothetical protein [Scrofimicrobium canadense]